MIDDRAKLRVSNFMHVSRPKANMIEDLGSFDTTNKNRRSADVTKIVMGPTFIYSVFANTTDLFLGVAGNTTETTR